MNKPMNMSALASEAQTTERSLSGKTGAFKPSVPANAVPPKPVIVPWQKKK